jgi:3-hydroxyisobutyrate dehydrogenase-like beta-hydroxyacid dehydrogenase
MIGCLRAAYEGASLAKAAGIDMDTFVKVMLETDNTGVGPMMFNERKADPAVDPVEAKARQRYADMIIKDMQASQKLAMTIGVKVPLMDLTLDTVEEIVGFAAHS